MDEIPRPKPETIIVDQHERVLAIIDGQLLWPPNDALVVLGNPNRTAVVRDVRLRLSESHASVVVSVEDLGEVVEGLEEDAFSVARAFEQEELARHDGVESTGARVAQAGPVPAPPPTAASFDLRRRGFFAGGTKAVRSAPMSLDRST